MIEPPVSLVAILRERARFQANQVALTFLGMGGAPETTMTYEMLDRQARGVAAALQNHCRPGDRAVLLLPPGLDFVVAFLGCLYASVVAVPVHLPRGERQLPRFAAVIADCEPRIALTSQQTLSRGGPALATLLAAATVACLAIDDLPPNGPDAWSDPGIGQRDIALLQYTSGSTGSPRGVILDHGNLLHNSAAIHVAFGHGPDSVSLLWVPPTHDMGLIGGIIQPIFGGFPGYLMSPLAFVKHPLGWLQAIDRYRVTTSGGPNFAYDLCVERVRPEDLATLDLGHWRLAFSGAEPVRAETLAEFAKTFAGCGFRPDAFYSCYGLAESTLIVSGGPADRIDPVSGGRSLVSSGTVLGGQDLRIVDPNTALPCAAMQVGEIWLAGPSVARGVWKKSPDGLDAFAARFAGSEEGIFLRTGDLGLMIDGQLVVTGRLKDLIIEAGRNHYPQDLEATADHSHENLRRGGAAAFSVAAPEMHDDGRVVVVQEATGSASILAAAIDALRRAIAAEHDLSVAAVCLIKPGTLPRTTSGKVRRSHCRDLYVAGKLSVLASWEPISWP